MRPNGLHLSMFLLAAGAVSPALAQSAGCSIEQVGGTQREVVRCGSGISILVEPGADFTLLDRSGDGAVDRVRVNSKALLLDITGGSDSGGFDVVAPQAIAAVRGTRWAVDAQGETTSVFVVEGEVTVGRRSGAARVVLGPGEGVDVAAGAGALTVRRWPARRVNALLARFGL